MAKKHRLNRKFYTGLKRISFTLCVKDKKNLFDDEGIVKEFISVLKFETNKQNVKNWVYVFMPDHLHIILEGTTEESDLWKTIKIFKQKAGYLLKREVGERFKLQKDFFDYIHRKNDDLIKHIKYVAENPVRKRLVKDWRNYKKTGSIHYNLEELIGNIS